MRFIAVASMLLIGGCASGGTDPDDDAGASHGGRDAATTYDAGVRRDAGHIQLPGFDGGGTTRDAGAPSGCAGASDGTSCDADADGCTVGDRCMSGECVAGAREDCGGSSACGTATCVSTSASTFRCDTSGTGGSCDDGDACTTGDACSGGTCAGTPRIDGSEPNDARASARSLGTVSDSDDYPHASTTASLYPDGDEDWFRFHDSDDWGAIYPRIDLSNVPAGSDYDLCAYYQCDSSSPSVGCESGTSSTFEGLPGCCSAAGGSASESVRLNPDCSGVDDSGTVYVRVYRYGGSATCADYTLAWGDD